MSRPPGAPAAALLLLATACGPSVEPPTRPLAWAQLDPLVRELVDDGIRIVENALASPEAWYQLGMIEEANGLYGEAQTSYERVLALRPDDARALHRLAAVQERTGDLALAADTMARAADAAPDFPASWWRLAWWSLDLGRIDEAESALARARALAPDDVAVRLGAVRVALARRDAAAARAALAQGDLLRGEAAGYALHLSSAALRMQGDLAAAAAAAARADAASLALADPWSAEMERFRTGYAAMSVQAGRDVRARRFGRAEPLLREILKNAPDDPRATNLLAVCRLEQGAPDEAAALLEELLRDAPDETMAAVNLARALERSPTATPEALAAADQHLRRAIEARPDDCGMWRVLAELALRRGRPAEALAALDRASALDPRALDVRVYAGYAALTAGDAVGALERFRALRADAPELAEARFGEAAALIAAGEEEDARRALDALAGEDPARVARLRQALDGAR